MSVKIANSGSTQSLQAKVGRFFTFSRSSSTSSKKPVSEGYDSTSATAAVSVQEQQDRVKGDEEGQETLGQEDSAAAGGGMQTLYLSHGSPMLPIQYDDPSRQFLVDLGMQIAKPKAIVIVSGHWDSTEPTVTARKTNDTIYDFYGFPKELYQLEYNAPGDPELAQRVVDLLKQGGFPKAKKDERRGLDHGAWVPLLMMYPERDVPVVQLSVQYHKDGAHHYKVGQALAPLRNEGVLVIGSGSATHNLGVLNFDGETAPWAIAFDNWLNDAICNNRYEEVINYKEKAPYARKAHPTPDHFLPAIVALGTAGHDAVGEQLHSGWVLGTISMASYALKSPSTLVASA